MANLFQAWDEDIQALGAAKASDDQIEARRQQLAEHFKAKAKAAGLSSKKIYETLDQFDAYSRQNSTAQDDQLTPEEQEMAQRVKDGTVGSGALKEVGKRFKDVGLGAVSSLTRMGGDVAQTWSDAFDNDKSELSSQIAQGLYNATDDIRSNYSEGTKQAKKDFWSPAGLTMGVSENLGQIAGSATVFGLAGKFAKAREFSRGATLLTAGTVGAPLAYSQGYGQGKENSLDEINKTSNAQLWENVKAEAKAYDDAGGTGEVPYLVSMFKEAGGDLNLMKDLMAENAGNVTGLMTVATEPLAMGVGSLMSRGAAAGGKGLRAGLVNIMNNQGMSNELARRIAAGGSAGIASQAAKIAAVQGARGTFQEGTQEGGEGYIAKTEGSLAAGRKGELTGKDWRGEHGIIQQGLQGAAIGGIMAGGSVYSSARNASKLALEKNGLPEKHDAALVAKEQADAVLVQAANIADADPNNIDAQNAYAKALDAALVATNDLDQLTGKFNALYTPEEQAVIKAKTMEGVAARKKVADDAAKAQKELDDAQAKEQADIAAQQAEAIKTQRDEVISRLVPMLGDDVAISNELASLGLSEEDANTLLTDAHKEAKAQKKAQKKAGQQNQSAPKTPFELAVDEAFDANGNRNKAASQDIADKHGIKNIKTLIDAISERIDSNSAKNKAAANEALAQKRQKEKEQADVLSEKQRLENTLADFAANNDHDSMVNFLSDYEPTEADKLIKNAYASVENKKKAEQDAIAATKKAEALKVKESEAKAQAEQKKIAFNNDMANLYAANPDRNPTKAELDSVGKKHGVKSPIELAQAWVKAKNEAKAAKEAAPKLAFPSPETATKDERDITVPTGMNINRDNIESSDKEPIIVRSNGQPFQTQEAAEQAIKNKSTKKPRKNEAPITPETHEVIPVDGGYAIAPVVEIQQPKKPDDNEDGGVIADAPKPNAPVSPTGQQVVDSAPTKPVEDDGIKTKHIKQPKPADRTVYPHRDDLLTAIAKMKGLNKAQAIYHGIKDSLELNKRGRGLLGVFKEDGRGFDVIARELSDMGYPVNEGGNTPYDNINGTPTPDALLDALRKALFDEDVGTEEYILNKYAAQREADQKEAEEMERLFNGKGSSSWDEADALDNVSDAIVNDITNVISTVAPEKLSETLKEVSNEPIIETSGQTPNASTEAKSPQNGDAETTGNGKTGQQESQSSTGQDSGIGLNPSFNLNAQTNEELAKRDADNKAAEAKRQAQEKAAKDKAQADKDVSDFRLSGSNAPADVAMAGGQNDMFAPPTRGEREAEKAETKQEQPQDKVIANNETNWIGADKAFSKNIDNDYGPSGAISEAVDFAKSSPKGTTTLETIIRPNGNKWHTLYLSNGKGGLAIKSIGGKQTESLESVVAYLEDEIKKESESAEVFAQNKRKEEISNNKIAEKEGFVVGLKLGTIIPNTNRKIRQAYIAKNNNDGTFDVEGLFGNKPVIIKGMSALGIKDAIQRHQNTQTKQPETKTEPKAKIDFSEASVKLEDVLNKWEAIKKGDIVVTKSGQRLIAQTDVGNRLSIRFKRADGSFDALTVGYVTGDRSVSVLLSKRLQEQSKNELVKKLIGKTPEGKDLYEDGRGVRFTDNGRGVQVGEDVAITMQNGNTVYDVSGRTDEHRTVEEVAARQPKPQPKEEKPAPAKEPSKNTIFTEDAAEAARARLKKKLGGNQLNSGFDPEILQDGLILAGYHIEKGARSFAAFAKAIVEDMGDVVKPYIKSWYMGVKYDPRAANFDGMSGAAEVDSADIESILKVDSQQPATPTPTANGEIVDDYDENDLDAGDGTEGWKYGGYIFGDDDVSYGVGYREIRKVDSNGTQRVIHQIRIYNENRASYMAVWENESSKITDGILDGFSIDTAKFHFSMSDATENAFSNDATDGDALWARFGREITDSIKYQMSREPKPNKAPKDKIGLPAPSAIKTLTDLFYDHLKKGTLPKDNVALRKMVAEFDGKEVDNYRLKAAQEDLEAAMASYARDVVAAGNNDATTFNQLLDTYQNQPNLNIRTSTSVENQAYSTPAPLAFIAARLAGIDRSTTVYEPTAGNGMLLLTAKPSNAIANELEDTRFANLKAQGFNTHQGDAVQAIANGVVKENSQDAIITNPPFGSIKDKDGNPTKIQVDGYKLGKIDHLIAAEALRAMKDKGRATLIIGADKVAGGVSTDDRIFFNWLYSHYNVTGHFELDGKLYNRQGAGWPVRVITINGRKVSNNVSPQVGTIQRYNTWEKVYEQYQLLATANSGRQSESSPVGTDLTQRNEQGAASNPNDTQGASTRSPSGGRSATGTSGIGGQSTRNVSDRNGAKPDELRGSDNGQRLDGRTNAQDNLAIGDNRDTAKTAEPNQGSTGRTDTTKPVGSVLTDADNAFQVKYTPHSSRKDEGVLVPVNMKQTMADALSILEDQVGDIDKYAAKELGYKSVGELHDALMGLQVDSVASAIYQMSAKNKGVIIADQTGIGKGRQAAAIIRWAKNKGLTPVFVTKMPSLFTDMYGDLADIGSNDISPFIMNLDASISSADGKKLFGNKPATHKKNIESIIATGRLPEGSNALFLTYSQINTTNNQRKALNAIAANAIFILDESHNAGGSSSTGLFMRNTLKEVQGVVYLSATFAKRPDNMPLYFKTDMGESVSDTGQLSTIMAQGGLPLQTIVSNALVKAGQMFRRERSYNGVSIVTKVDSSNKAKHEKLSDKTTEALRAITNADSLFHTLYFSQLEKEMEARGEALKEAGNNASESVNHTEFSSVVHNFIRQMLLGLKADAAANEAIAALKSGEKPLIALENTMGSFLEGHADSNNLSDGDSLGDFGYRNVLSRALERSRYIIHKNAQGEEERLFIQLSELDPKTRAAYDQAQRIIDNLDIDDIPVSPLDWIRHRIQQAGYSVAEITGRDLAVDYSTETPTLTKVPLIEQNDKVNTTRMFNDGRLDAIILNVAGSTGISLHASEKFKDQRQRHMIVAQPAQDINIFMQMLGRIHRTGQVVLPKYTILNVDLAAEKRPTALLNKKMKSLNANTSSNTESATSIKSVDMLNKYGDQVINAFLRENPDIAVALRIGFGEDDAVAELDIARKATGRMALLPVSKQMEIYNEVEEQYNSLISYLDETGQNDLEPRTIDYAAEMEKEAVMVEATDDKTPFGQEAVYGEYKVKAQGKPMTFEQMKELATKNLNGNANGKEHAKAFIEQQRKTLPVKDDYATLLAVDDLDAANAIMASFNQGADYINSHYIGSAWTIDIKGDIYNAVVTNIRTTHKGKGNPLSASKIQFTLAVNGALRSITIPATEFKRIEVGPSRGDLRQIFAPRANDQDIVKIITGNLLAGYANLVGMNGSIISFTKKDGSIEQGILLPKKFDFKENARHDFQLKTAREAVAVLEGMTDSEFGRFGIASRLGDIRITRQGDNLKIVVPKSKATGGKWFLDKELMAIVGDFVSNGNMMQVIVRGSDKEKALAVVLKKSPLYVLPSMAEEAKEIVAKNSPKFSRGTGEGLTTSQVRQSLVNRFGEKVIKALESSGLLTIMATPPSWAEPDADGAYDKDSGKAYLFTDNLSAETVVATLAHELGGHKGFQELMTPTAYDSLMRQFNRLVKQGNAIALAAKARAEAAEVVTPTADTKEAIALAEKQTLQRQQDEYLPYLLTLQATLNATRSQQSAVTKVIEQVYRAVKAWLYRTLSAKGYDGLASKLLQPKDITLLAERMIREMGNGTNPNSNTKGKSQQGMARRDFVKLLAVGSATISAAGVINFLDGKANNTKSDAIKSVVDEALPELLNKLNPSENFLKVLDRAIDNLPSNAIKTSSKDAVDNAIQSLRASILYFSNFKQNKVIETNLRDRITGTPFYINYDDLEATLHEMMNTIESNREVIEKQIALSASFVEGITGVKLKKFDIFSPEDSGIIHYMSKVDDAKSRKYKFVDIGAETYIKGIELNPEILTRLISTDRQKQLSAFQTLSHELTHVIQNQTKSQLEQDNARKGISQKDSPIGVDTFIPEGIENIHKKYLERQYEGSSVLKEELEGFNVGYTAAKAWLRKNNMPLRVASKQDIIERLEAAEKMSVDKNDMLDKFGYQPTYDSVMFSQLNTPQTQINAVRKKYEGTSQWMKAPNGEPTKLNEVQWLQVRTPNFKAWFGDWEGDAKNASKVVDSNGEPMVVYHGTAKKFNTFKYDKIREGTLGSGFYFSSDKYRAEDYANANGKVIEVFLKIENLFNTQTGKTIGNGVKNYGVQSIDEFMVERNTQIKSAIGNTGEFNPTNPDIRFSRKIEALAKWSSERVKSLLRQYAYASNDKKTKAFATFVSPDDFLKATTTKELLSQIERDTDNFDYMSVLGDMNNQPIKLVGTLEGNTFTVSGHEGRHRMMALKKSGIKSAPVVFELNNGQELNAIDRVIVKGQKFDNGNGGNFEATNTIPINWENNNKLQDAMQPSENTIRFSRKAKNPITEGIKSAANDAKNSLPDPIAKSIDNFMAGRILPSSDMANITAKTELSIYKRTIGTQLNTALQLPDFKKVYDMAQRYLQHVAVDAYAALKVAPNLLGKLESWSDLKKDVKKIWPANFIKQKADRAAVASIIFDETLNNELLSDADILKALTRDQRQIYKEARDAIQVSLENTAKSEMVRKLLAAEAINWQTVESLINQDLPVEQFAQTVRDMVESRIGGFKNELEAILDADPKIKEAFKTGNDKKLTPQTPAQKLTLKEARLTPEQMRTPAQKLAIEEAKATPNKKQQLTPAQKATLKKAKTLKAQIETTEEALKSLNDVENRLGTLIEQGYAPLMRFGEYTLTVRDLDGKVKSFFMFESKAEQVRATNAIVARYGKTVKLETDMISKEEFKQFAGMTPETMALFAKETGMDKDEAYQHYLKLAIPARSAMTRMIKRKGTEGFSDDIQRVVASFVMSNARMSAKNIYAAQIEKSIQDIESGKSVKDQAYVMKENVFNPKENSAQLRNFLFLWNLGGSIFFGLLNMTQPYMQTLPHLSQYVPIGDATRAILRGSKIAGSAMKNGTAPKGYEAEYNRAVREGVVDPQNVFMLSSVERGKTGASNSAWGVITHTMGLIAQVTESFNRKAVFIASLQVAKQKGDVWLKKKGFNSAYDFAKDTVDQTQGVYDKANRSNWANTSVGAPLMVFKQFSINYVEQMVRMWKKEAASGDEGKKAVFLMLAMLASLSGVMGLPFIKDILDVSETTAAFLGNPVNIEREARLALGKDLADPLFNGVLNHFVFNNLGMDIQGRTGMPDLVPWSNALNPTLSAQGRINEFASIAGATGGLIEKGYDATQLIARDEYGAAAKTLAPRFLTSWIDGSKMALTNEVMDRKGNKLFDTTWDEGLVKFIDANPKRMADLSRTKSLEWKDKSIQAYMTTNFKQKIIAAMMDNDQAEVQNLMKKVQEWNTSRPKYPVFINLNTLSKNANKKEQTFDARESIPKGMDWMKNERPEM